MMATESCRYHVAGCLGVPFTRLHTTAADCDITKGNLLTRKAPDIIEPDLHKQMVNKLNMQLLAAFNYSQNNSFQ
jgi:hypothetical protein